MSKIAGGKIEQSSYHSCKKWKTDARSPDLHKDSSDYHHHEYRLKKRIKQELDKFVKERHIVIHTLDDELITIGNRICHFIYGLIYSFAISYLHRLSRRHTEHICGISH